MELGLLKDIVIIFALSTLVNLLFTRLKIPTIPGYLMTGVIAGPHLLGLIDSEADIELLAEIGGIFLLFTIGMEFSLKHLLRFSVSPSEPVSPFQNDYLIPFSRTGFFQKCARQEHPARQ